MVMARNLLRSALQPPRKPAGDADDIVLGDRDDDGDEHAPVDGSAAVTPAASE